MAAGALLVFCPQLALAHDISRSESTITLADATVRVRFGINLLELKGVDVNGDERVTYEELDAAVERVFAAIKQHFVLAAPAPPARVVMERQEIVEDHMLSADLVYTFDRPVRQLDVASTLDAVTTPGHVHHVRAQIGGELSQALLTPADRSVTFLVGGATFGRLAAVLLGFLGVAALIAYRTIQRQSSRSREDHEEKQEHTGH